MVGAVIAPNDPRDDRLRSNEFCYGVAHLFAENTAQINLLLRVLLPNRIRHLQVTDIVNFWLTKPSPKTSCIAQTSVNIGPNQLAQLSHRFGTAFAILIIEKRRSVDCRRSG